jgi:hypothetical protein
MTTTPKACSFTQSKKLWKEALEIFDFAMGKTRKKFGPGNLKEYEK